MYRESKTGCKNIIDHFREVCTGWIFSNQIVGRKGKKGHDRNECFTKTLRVMCSYRLNDRFRKYKKHLTIGEGH